MANKDIDLELAEAVAQYELDPLGFSGARLSGMGQRRAI